MPKVPLAKIGGVQTQALPRARVATDAPGAAFGEGIGRVGEAAAGFLNTVGEIVEKEKANADKANVDILEAEARKMSNDALRGKDGYLSKQGKDAADFKEQFDKDFSTRLDKFDERITNDRQRELWRSRRARIELDVDNTVENHAFREMQKFTESKIQDGVDFTRQDAALNYLQKGKVEDSLIKQRALINNLADMRGLSNESRQKMLAEAGSSTHTAVIAGMLGDNQDKLAKDHFKKYSKEFTAEDRIKVQGMLEEGTIRGESQRQADKIMGMNLSNQDALNKARDIKDPEVRDETVGRVKQRYQEQRAIKKEAQVSLYEQNFSLIEKNYEEKRRVSKDDIPPDKWNSMSPTNKKSMAAYIDKLNTGKPIKTDWNTYYNLRDMATDPARTQEFKDYNLMADRLKLADAEFKELVKLRGDLKAGKGSAQIKIDGYRSDKQIVDDNLRQHGFDLRTKKKDKITEMNEIRAEIDRRVVNFKTRTATKHIQPNDLQNIIDATISEAVDPESGFLGFYKEKKRISEIPFDQRSKFTVDIKQVPAYDKRRISEKLRQQGKEVTDDVIVDYYLRKIERIERETR